MNRVPRMNRRRWLAAAAALAGAAALDSAHAADAGPLPVVASFSILADMVKTVGGDAVSVHALVGPDADAHVFEPSPADARRLAQARLVVVNGLRFEGWIDRLIAVSGYRGPVATASAGIAARTLEGGPDPHAWQNLANAKRYVENIRDALAQARPADAAGFKARAAAYLEKIDALDREVRARFAAIPAAERQVITSHDAFGYFGAAYGVRFLAAQGWNTESEPSAADVARLIDQIRKQRVRAVFVENISDPRLAQRIAREGGVVVGGTLYSDALSPPGSEADTYLKLFAHNAAALAGGMQGRAAP